MAVFYPYANDPSKKTVLIEILSLLIILAAVPAWLGGTIAIFVTGYALAIGVWGLFGSWTRRQSILLALLSLVMIAFLIVNIIMAALDKGKCLPDFFDDDDGSDRFINFDDNNNNNNNVNNNATRQIFLTRNRWCGSALAVYITHGILIGLLIPFLLLALLASREEREWEKAGRTARASGVAHTKTTTTTTTTAHANAMH